MKRLAVILAVLLACGCSAQMHVNPAAPAPVKHPASRLLVGAAALSESRFQQATGVRPTLVEHYIAPGDPFSAAFAGSAVPLIQIEPYGIPLSGITAGREDGWLRSYARAVAAYRKPVVLGFAPEMNGSWYSWGYKHATAAVYVAAWRHVVSVFRSQGAGNVTWLWTANVKAIGSGGAARVASPGEWWPGSAWVTWIGVDGYYLNSGESFASVFGPTLTAVRRLGRPVLISETGVSPDADQAGKIPDLFAGAVKDGLIGLVWFDLKGNQDWRLGSPAALSAFRSAVKEYG